MKLTFCCVVYTYMIILGNNLCGKSGVCWHCAESGHMAPRPHLPIITQALHWEWGQILDVRRMTSCCGQCQWRLSLLFSTWRQCPRWPSTCISESTWYVETLHATILPSLIGLNVFKLWKSWPVWPWHGRLRWVDSCQQPLPSNCTSLLPHSYALLAVKLPIWGRTSCTW